jgi:multimeric flavodoxin WrbA
MDRRYFLAKSIVMGGVAALGSTALAEPRTETKIRIVGVSCSPRKGMTTATGVQTALDAAQETNPRIQIELIDLGEMFFSGWNSTGKFQHDHFDEIVLPKLKDPYPDGLIIGSPIYFRNISSVCMAFLERLAVLRAPSLQLADVPVGALTVGAYRNGGQEMGIQQIQAAMLCHEAAIVGGKPGAHQGATLLNAYNDDITKDEFGIKTARQLGIRVAEAALKTKRI